MVDDAAQSGLRVVILSAIPEVAAMTATTLRRLGHEPVAAVGALRRKPTPGLSSLTATSEVPGTEVIIAPDKDSVEPILRSLSPDLVLSWAFPWRVLEGALAVPRYGSVNYHPSLLPRHRGSNPVAWTIRMGDSNYGVTWHRMEPGFDSGPILAQRASPVLEEDTIYDVVPRLNMIGLRTLRGVLERVARGDPGDPQPTEGVTEAGPFGDDYATIDWSMPAREIHTQVRAWAFTPGTHSVIGPIAELQGRRVRVLRTSLQPPEDVSGRDGLVVECGDGPLWVLATELLE
jgi:methionyl-tRNA formyltransferase